MAKEESKAPEAEIPDAKDVGAPSIIEPIVERILADRHVVVDAVDGMHRFAGQKVRVKREFLDAHPECFI